MEISGDVAYGVKRFFLKIRKRKETKKEKDEKK
jgi:hypothetical protein